VLESEILEGARFYDDLVLAFGDQARSDFREETHGAALGSR
jgi:hypothetical protein